MRVGSMETVRKWVKQWRFWEWIREKKNILDEWVRSFTFGKSRRWLASRKSSSSDREYRKISSGISVNEAWLLSMNSTCRLHLRRGMQRNIVGGRCVMLLMFICGIPGKPRWTEWLLDCLTQIMTTPLYSSSKKPPLLGDYVGIIITDDDDVNASVQQVTHRMSRQLSWVSEGRRMHFLQWRMSTEMTKDDKPTRGIGRLVKRRGSFVLYVRQSVGFSLSLFPWWWCWWFWWRGRWRARRNEGMQRLWRRRGMVVVNREKRMRCCSFLFLSCHCNLQSVWKCMKGGWYGFYQVRKGSTRTGKAGRRRIEGVRTRRLRNAASFPLVEETGFPSAAWKPAPSLPFFSHLSLLSLTAGVDSCPALFPNKNKGWCVKLDRQRGETRRTPRSSSFQPFLFHCSFPTFVFFYRRVPFPWCLIVRKNASTRREKKERQRVEEAE